MTKWKPLVWTVHLSGWNRREQHAINRYFLFSPLLLSSRLFSFLLSSCLVLSRLVSFPLLFSTFIEPNPARDSSRNKAFLFFFLELHWISWNSFHFPLNPRQVWGVHRSVSLICFLLETHTNKHVHSYCYTWVQKQHTRSKVRHADFPRTHVNTQTRRSSIQLQYSDIAKHNTQMHMHGKYKLGKHAHHMFLAPGRKNESPEGGAKHGRQRQSNNFYLYTLAPLTERLHWHIPSCNVI